VDASLDAAGSILVALDSEGAVHAWTLERTPVALHVHALPSIPAPAIAAAIKQLVVHRSTRRTTVATLCSAGDDNSILRYDLEEGASAWHARPALSSSRVSCCSATPDGFLFLVGGSLYALGADSAAITHLYDLPVSCASLQVWRRSNGSDAIVGLGADGQLAVAGWASPVAGGVTSFALVDGLLAYTTSSSKLAWRDLGDRYGSSAADPPATRSIERGALLVAATQTAVYLQMPRGNLEIVHPRALLLRQVQHLVVSSDFPEAFALCRKHRIAFTCLLADDVTPLLASLDTFIDVVDQPDHISLFLQNLRSAMVPSRTKPLFDSAQRLFFLGWRRIGHSDRHGRLDRINDPASTRPPTLSLHDLDCSALLAACRSCSRSADRCRPAWFVSFVRFTCIFGRPQPSR
jgi:hypothetical protein